MSIGCAKCCLCVEEHGLDEIEHVELKSETKKICIDSITTIKVII